MQTEIPLVRLYAARQRLPADAVFSGCTAAWLHNLDMHPCNPIEVTLPRRSTTSRLRAIRVTRSDLTESEVCSIHDLPATSATRTIADLARRLPLVEAVQLLDLALHRRTTSVDAFHHWIQTHRGCRDIKRLRRAIELADGAAESPMETRLRLLLVLHGLPRPSLQTPLHDAAGCYVARPDLYYPRVRLAIEYDGVSHRASLESDNRRQNRILEAGYRLLRFTAGDILNRPASVVAQVQRALSYSIGSPN